MIRRSIALAAAAGLASSPCVAAELLDEQPSGAPRSSAVAGAYVRISLDGPASVTSTSRAGIRLAMSHDVQGPRAFSFKREANLLDLRLTGTEGMSFYVAGQPLSGAEADRLNAAGESKGRLDKIMIGAGVALGAVAAFFLVSSVTG